MPLLFPLLTMYRDISSPKPSLFLFLFAFETLQIFLDLFGLFVKVWKLCEPLEVELGQELLGSRSAAADVHWDFVVLTQHPSQRYPATSVTNIYNVFSPKASNMDLQENLEYVYGMSLIRQAVAEYVCENKGFRRLNKLEKK